jgi:hypothetical protein
MTGKRSSNAKAESAIINPSMACLWQSAVAISLQQPSSPAHQIDDRDSPAPQRKRMDQSTGNMEAESK